MDFYQLGGAQSAVNAYGLTPRPLAESCNRVLTLIAGTNTKIPIFLTLQFISACHSSRRLCVFHRQRSKIIRLQRETNGRRLSGRELTLIVATGKLTDILINDGNLRFYARVSERLILRQL